MPRTPRTFVATPAAPAPAAPDAPTPTPSVEEFNAIVARCQRAEQLLAEAKAAQAKVSFRMSEKGGGSVYGLGRFPVTLYRSQWERLATLMATPEWGRFVATLPTKA